MKIPSYEQLETIPAFIDSKKIQEVTEDGFALTVKYWQVESPQTDENGASLVIIKFGSKWQSPFWGLGGFLTTKVKQVAVCDLAIQYFKGPKSDERKIKSAFDLADSNEMKRLGIEQYRPLLEAVFKALLKTRRIAGLRLTLKF